MFSKVETLYLRIFAISVFVIGCYCSTLAQQTLGGITGTITDASGSTIPDANVTAVEDSTHLTRTATTNSGGSYAFVNLPIGSYTLTYTRDGFDSSKYPGINVQADRTVTLNVSLKVGTVSTSVEVECYSADERHRYDQRLCTR